MKKLIAIFFLFSLQSSVYGQYQSMFGLQSTEWMLVEDWSNLDDPLFINYQLHVTDTIQEGDSSYYHIEGGFFYGNYNLFESYYILEDTIVGKAWARKDNSYPWVLFYDLSLQIGDTIENQDLLNSSQTIVDSVYFDSFGRKHIRFLDSYNLYERFEFIEGVGTTQGLLKMYWYNLKRPSLLCQFKDGIQTYSFENPLVVNCNYSLAINENELKHFNLSPNPSNGHVSLEIPENVKVLEINVLNMQGQVVFHQKGSTNELNLSFLGAGTYQVLLSTENGILHEKMCLLE